ncbi:hypothetical protein C8J56DRAFT_778967 [Mycena floridula]|nr:hypothetical protein C8J56DRAFT_778967 [Mycena floridula]
MGVKSLWSLLKPVGRPIMLETMEGTTMAIDSSIWLYQFQATMRDKEGKALTNAHILGFLRRICKLLFYGMKPVFVFDGGAPALKRNTLNDRRKKKAGALASHAKLAEKLLAAQLRREALKQAQRTGKGKASEGPVVLDENTVYLEDIDPSLPKSTPIKEKPTDWQSSTPSKPKFRDHDPYRLPELDLEQRIAKATSSALPDPRLATEEELRTFIEDMRPEDFDVTSPAFRELPTEVQYEIVGDLRLKSRQTSYTRLQQMLKSAPTPLDFSKQQIKNLQQRNTLTQQLLTTTDSIGKAHISIPIRIASERNKEYMLIKNDSGAGGWILGIRDDGTKAKPIVIDHEDAEDDSDDMEEVAIPVEQSTVDPDLRDYQREMALTAVANRYSPLKKKKPTPSTPKPQKPSTPLFELDEEEAERGAFSNDEDNDLAFAIQASLDHSKPQAPPPQAGPSGMSAREKEDLFSASTRLDTVLSFANSAPSSRFRPSGHRPSSRISWGKDRLSTPQSSSMLHSPVAGGSASYNTSAVSASPSTSFSVQGSSFGTPYLLISPEVERTSSPVSIPPISLADSPPSPPILVEESISQESDSDVDMEEVPIVAQVAETIRDGSPEQTSPTSELRASPEPVHDDHASPSKPSTDLSRPASPTGEWDAADEMDPHAEEGDFAQFISHVKGKDLDDVRREIDDEITALNHQKKAAIRDSEDISHQSISQIMMMLRLFGIPYITAPMEAEAQCAELVSLGLVDGIITDDSDVFLFGGERVFKNMFNQSKSVECFLQQDLSRELGLDRDTLIRLAYLLGSDYVDGVPGVGPVVAMELLKEFPGEDGLHKFKDWWLKVQSGKDKLEDNKSPFRIRFKRQFKDLFLSNEWPNATVRDAYYHPTVDESEEPFKWGLPDLDALREFIREELGWEKPKVDELLLPIIQKMGRRSQASAINKQSKLDDFLNLTGGASHAPRIRQVYDSKRLQQVVSDFRKKRKTDTSKSNPETSESESEVVPEPAKKKRKTPKGKAATRGGKAVRPARKVVQANNVDQSSDEGDGSFVGPTTSSVPLAATLREKKKSRGTLTLM